MNSVTFKAFADELVLLEKSANYALPPASSKALMPQIEQLISKSYMPVAGGFFGGVGGGALAGGEAYLHNRDAAEEDKKSVLGRTLAGAGIGAGIGAGSGYLGSMGLDKGKAYTQNLLHDLGKFTTEGFVEPLSDAARKFSDEAKLTIPKLTTDTIDAGARSIGASPLTATRGFFGRIIGR